MSGFNLPPGCYESDIPGWNDVTHSWQQECPYCGHLELIVADVDSRYGGEVDWECDNCKKEFVAAVNFDRSDDFDDFDSDY